MRPPNSSASTTFRMSCAPCAPSWRARRWPGASTSRRGSSNAAQSLLNGGLQLLELLDMQCRAARGKHGGTRGYGAEQRAQLAEKGLGLPIRQQPVRRGGANRNQCRGGDRDFAEHLEHAPGLEPIEVPAHQCIQEQEIE